MRAERLFFGLPHESLYQGFPVPHGFTRFLFENEGIAPYLVAFPWVSVILVGAMDPKSFFRAPDFILRFLAFLALELTLLVILVWSILSPFISYILQLKTDEATALERVFPVGFWITCLTGAATVVLNFVKRRRSKRTSSPSPLPRP